MQPISAVQRVPIALGDRSYTIAIGPALLSDPATFSETPPAATAVIVSNTTVAPLYARHLADALAGRYTRVHQVVLPDGESFKTWGTLNLIFDALLGHAGFRAPGGDPRDRQP